LTGTLYVVGTPIGNLGDLTQRAIETLRQVHHVAAEDTRRSRSLLSHLGITGKPVLRVDAHAETHGLEGLFARLERGEDVALVTDAGMPAVSDPGARVIRMAVDRGVTVVVVPGPSAVTAAIALSGLVEGPFLFLGFLPRHGGKRRRALGRIARTPEPVVLFEAPGRTAATLSDLSALMPDRSAVACRELTKLHEEVRRGRLAELAEIADWRGEVTLVLGSTPAGVEGDPVTHPGESLEQRIEQLLRSGSTTRQIVAELAPGAGLSRRELYAKIQALRALERG
jgi:16S rRNA (cytidine1402-2'-O)-methyltransferase